MQLSTFLAERYWPGASTTEVHDALARARAAGRELEDEGRGVQYLECAHVPKDESVVCLVRAAAIEDVLDTGRRAGIPFDRVTEAESLVMR